MKGLEAAVQLTVTRIGLKQLFNQHDLVLPELVAPPLAVARSARHVLKTPLAVRPDPVYLGMDAEVCHREPQVGREEPDNLLVSSGVSSLQASCSSRTH